MWGDVGRCGERVGEAWGDVERSRPGWLAQTSTWLVDLRGEMGEIWGRYGGELDLPNREDAVRLREAKDDERELAALREQQA